MKAGIRLFDEDSHMISCQCDENQNDERFEVRMAKAFLERVRFGKLKSYLVKFGEN